MRLSVCRPLPRRWRLCRLGCWTLRCGAGMLAAMVLVACTTYQDRVAPVPLPETSPNRVEVGGAKLLAQSYAAPEQARTALGFDARGAGLLPIRFVIDNQSDEIVQVLPGQTFLIDRQGQAWPLLSAEQAYQRVEGAVDLSETVRGAAKPGLLLGTAGAIAGAAIGVVTGENVGDIALRGATAGAALGTIGGGAEAYQSAGAQIRDDLAAKSLRNRGVKPNELAYGFLFFPGKDEAQSVRELRLGLKVGAIERIVTLRL